MTKSPPPSHQTEAKSTLAQEVSTLAKEVDVMTLIGGGREVVLLHRGERYRLRVTANGKLILTK